MHHQNKSQQTPLNVDAKASKTGAERNGYNPEFVEMVKKANKNGSYKEVNPNDVWSSLNLK